jgi:hypothetical protein
MVSARLLTGNQEAMSLVLTLYKVFKPTPSIGSDTTNYRNAMDLIFFCAPQDL